jgi:hypothetical protein
MSSPYFFAVFYDPTTLTPSRMVKNGEISNNDNPDAIAADYMKHCPPGHKAVFIPNQEAEQVDTILAGLGIGAILNPVSSQ